MQLVVAAAAGGGERSKPEQYPGHNSPPQTWAHSHTGLMCMAVVI